MKVQHRNPKPYATRILNTSLRILTQLKVLLTRMDDMTSPRLTNTWEVLERAHLVLLFTSAKTAPYKKHHQPSSARHDTLHPRTFLKALAKSWAVSRARQKSLVLVVFKREPHFDKAGRSYNPMIIEMIWHPPILFFWGDRITAKDFS